MWVCFYPSQGVEALKKGIVSVQMVGHNTRTDATGFFRAPDANPTRTNDQPAYLRFDENGLLDGEITRQKRLKAVLAADPATAGWIAEGALMRNYKFLQFMDTLALYFNLRHAGDRTQETFVHVPMSEQKDAEITLRPFGDDRYAVAPFPFAGDRLEVRCKGRYFEAVSEAQDDLAAHLYGLPEEEQVHWLLAA